jgi:hypothetical protein
MGKEAFEGAPDFSERRVRMLDIVFAILNFYASAL